MPIVAGAAVPLPGGADVSRVDKREAQRTIVSPELSHSFPIKIHSSTAPPATSKKIQLHLRALRIDGMKSFTPPQVADIYAPYLDRTITMDIVWLIAGQLTERYRNAGYFLSRVIVPEQEVKDGVVHLKVVEGYISEVSFDDPLKENSIVRAWIERLQSYKPLTSERLESAVLQLNDLPGIRLRAVLEPIDNAATNEGAVRLILERSEEPIVHGGASIDNNGSRFLGPYQATLSAQAMVVPLQRTSATLLSSLPWEELKFGSLKQEIPVYPGVRLELYGSRTAATPGYTLKSSEIRSESTQIGIAANYQLIRQRVENLSLRFAFEGRDTNSDILSTALTRDAIRTLRLGAQYEVLDGWNGSNSFYGTVTQGIGVLGSSKARQPNLSRIQATPEFTKFEANWNRSQTLNPQWSFTTAAAMQVASGPLYSAEEFGYGGTMFGRAYDDSEITGDHGFAATAEIRYTGFEALSFVQPVPYAFYDVGFVWNEDRDQPAYSSGSTGGAGLRMFTDYGFSANFGIAIPVTRAIQNPIYGSGRDPRLLMQINYGF